MVVNAIINNNWQIIHKNIFQDMTQAYKNYKNNISNNETSILLIYTPVSIPFLDPQISASEFSPQFPVSTVLQNLS